MNNTNMMVGSIYRLCRLFQIQKELGRGLTYSEWTDYTQSIRKEFDEILLEMYDRARQIAPESVDGIDRAAVVRKEAQTAFDPDNTWSTHYGPLSQALLWEFHQATQKNGSPLNIHQVYDFATEVKAKLKMVDLSAWKRDRDFQTLDLYFQMVSLMMKKHIRGMN